MATSGRQSHLTSSLWETRGDYRLVILPPSNWSPSPGTLADQRQTAVAAGEAVTLHNRNHFSAAATVNLCFLVFSIFL